MVHRDVQPRVDGLTADDHVLTGLERVVIVLVPRLDQDHQLVVVARIQQLQVYPPVGAVPGSGAKSPSAMAAMICVRSVCAAGLGSVGRGCYDQRSGPGKVTAWGGEAAVRYSINIPNLGDF